MQLWQITAPGYDWLVVVRAQDQGQALSVARARARHLETDEGRPALHAQLLTDDGPEEVIEPFASEAVRLLGLLSEATDLVDRVHDRHQMYPEDWEILERLKRA